MKQNIVHTYILCLQEVLPDILSPTYSLLSNFPDQNYLYIAEVLQQKRMLQMSRDLPLVEC